MPHILCTVSQSHSRNHLQGSFLSWCLIEQTSQCYTYTCMNQRKLSTNVNCGTMAAEVDRVCIGSVSLSMSHQCYSFCELNHLCDKTLRHKNNCRFQRSKILALSQVWLVAHKQSRQAHDQSMTLCRYCTHEIGYQMIDNTQHRKCTHNNVCLTSNQ